MLCPRRGPHQTGSRSAGAFSGFELFSSQIDVGNWQKQQTSRSVLIFGSQTSTGWDHGVVMSGEAGGTMVHEACRHGLERILSKRNSPSMLARKVKRWPQIWSCIDDATIP